jgi:hypothetical protein
MRKKGWGLVPQDEGRVFFPGENEGDGPGIKRGEIPEEFNRTHDKKKAGLNSRESEPG